LEASGISADAALKPRTSEVISDFISKYGLIAILIAFPAYYGIQDLIDDGNLTRLGNNLADGISNGAIWALVALGYTLVYGIIELINFAHGEIFMIGAFAAFGLWGTLG
jgi:branched-chain amino acid transport system permease protein